MNREEKIFATAKMYSLKNYGDDEDRAFAIEDFQAGAQWADDNPKSQWISVEDRMPEPELYNYSEKVLLLCKGESVYYAFYDYERKIWLRCFEWASIIGKPTHWMPIPKFPNVDPKK